MKKRFMFCIVLLVPALLLFGCSLFNPTFDDSDSIVAADKSVSKEDLARIASYLLNTVPYVRQEKARLAQGNKKVRLGISILSAPEREYAKNDPAYLYRVNCYEVYVTYTDKDATLKTNNYLVHHDLLNILRYDEDTDNFVKVSP